MRRGVRAVAAVLLVLGVAACGTPDPGQRPVVLGEVPHDPSAFTQGLELAPEGGVLYEGTGLVGRSQLRELDPATGAVRRAVPVPNGWFGEGITVSGDRIWQLTWTDGVALEWDRASLRLLRTVEMDGEGWGLCRDGDRLVRSDGSSRLRFHDPVTFAETGGVDVTLDGAPVDGLNELECVGGRGSAAGGAGGVGTTRGSAAGGAGGVGTTRGSAAGGAGGVGTTQVWANVWGSDRIVRIDPASGRVTAVVDASGLLAPDRRQGTDVLNGIAALGGDEYLLTGKLWPAMFRVRLPADPPGND